MQTTANTKPLPGTDAALAQLLATGTVDLDSARIWLEQALGCLREPLDGASVGNAGNQAAKALAALGSPQAFTGA